MPPENLEDLSVTDVKLYPPGVAWDGLEPVAFYDGPTTVVEHISTEDFLEDCSFYDCSSLVIQGEIVVDPLPKKLSKKRFKKWLMSKGIRRDDADELCRCIGILKGRFGYSTVVSDIFAYLFLPVNFWNVFQAIIFREERT